MDSDAMAREFLMQFPNMVSAKSQIDKTEKLIVVKS